MIILYLVSFIAGLLLAVRVMISGVERPREDHPSHERSFRLSPVVLAVFGLVFGLVGYLSARMAFTGGSAAVALVVALVAAGLAALAVARAVRRWWTVTPEHEVEDERYLLQGHLAHVTRSIEANTDGEVAFEVEGKHHVLRARNFETGVLPAGTDVVIERIEDDIAYVEAWMEVEKRL